MFLFNAILLCSLLFAAIPVLGDPTCLEEFGTPTASNCAKAIQSMLSSVAELRRPSAPPLDQDILNFRVPSTQQEANAWASLLNTRFQLRIPREDYYLPLIWAHDDCALLLAVERIDAIARSTWTAIANLATGIKDTCTDTQRGPGFGGEDYGPMTPPIPVQSTTNNVLVQLRSIIPPNSKIDPARLSTYYVTPEAMQDFVRDVADGNPWLNKYAETGGVHLPQTAESDPERAWTVPDGAQICEGEQDCKPGFGCVAKQISNAILVYGTTLIASIGTCVSST